MKIKIVTFELSLNFNVFILNLLFFRKELILLVRLFVLLFSSVSLFEQVWVGMVYSLVIELQSHENEVWLLHVVRTCNFMRQDKVDYASKIIFLIIS